jgi:hypothetical protein
MQSSANKIANATISYYRAASLLHVFLLVSEKTWWWLALARKKMWWWIASIGDSYHGDVLQYTKQIFSLRLPQMTKYCFMRECDNIHSWISLSGDLAFSHQHGIYGFKFPKRFLEISSRDLTSLFSLLAILII